MARRNWKRCFPRSGQPTPHTCCQCHTLDTLPKCICDIAYMRTTGMAVPHTVQQCHSQRWVICFSSISELLERHHQWTPLPLLLQHTSIPGVKTHYVEWVYAFTCTGASTAATHVKHMRNHRRIHMSSFSMVCKESSEASAMTATQAERHNAGLSCL